MGFLRRSYGPRTMLKTVFPDCNQEGEVPFVPREGCPFSCRECDQKHRRY